ncbi:MAG: hypothetical protein SGCHY_003525 [Lobulomycetales sp.]
MDDLLHEWGARQTANSVPLIFGSNTREKMCLLEKAVAKSFGRDNCPFEIVTLPSRGYSVLSQILLGLIDTFQADIPQVTLASAKFDQIMANLKAAARPKEQALSPKVKTTSLKSLSPWNLPSMTHLRPCDLSDDSTNFRNDVSYQLSGDSVTARTSLMDDIQCLLHLYSSLVKVGKIAIVKRFVKAVGSSRSENTDRPPKFPGKGWKDLRQGVGNVYSRKRL